jgi:hypothetical protein
MRTAHEFWDILKSKQVTSSRGSPAHCWKVSLMLASDPAVTYIPAVRRRRTGDRQRGALDGTSRRNFDAELWPRQRGQPLTSFNLIYRIPVLMVVSWRGYGGKDAPSI